MNQITAVLTICTPRRQLVMAMILCGFLVSGVLPYPPQLISTVAFGEVVPCQDDGFGCEELILVLSETGRPR